MSVRHIEVVINMLLGYRNVLDVRDTAQMYFAISTKMYLFNTLDTVLALKLKYYFSHT